jgi:hypothetical protein
MDQSIGFDTDEPETLFLIHLITLHGVTKSQGHELEVLILGQFSLSRNYSSMVAS